MGPDGGMAITDGALGCFVDAVRDLGRRLGAAGAP
jgi:hypothetical protein